MLVSCGIVFAAIQPTTTELEISSNGVKVNSPVPGVIILVISLAFFYLYLVYLCPIENVFWGIVKLTIKRRSEKREVYDTHSDIKNHQLSAEMAIT